MGKRSLDASRIRALEQLLKAPLKRSVIEGFDYDKPSPNKEQRPPQIRKNSFPPKPQKRMARIPKNGKQKVRN